MTVMVVERVSRPTQAQRAAPTSADRLRVILRFAAIEGAGVVALLVFLLGFFTLDWFPGQPTPILAGALIAFAFYILFALWASGLLAMIITDRNNAGR